MKKYILKADIKEDREEDVEITSFKDVLNAASKYNYEPDELCREIGIEPVYETESNYHTWGDGSESYRVVDTYEVYYAFGQRMYRNADTEYYGDEWIIENI